MSTLEVIFDSFFLWESFCLFNHTWFRVAENDGFTGKNGTTCKGINALSTCACHTIPEKKEFN